MAVFNEFRLIGICYGDAKLHCYSVDKARAYVTLAVDSSVNNKKQFIPLIFPNSLHEKASFIARNGNTIAVTGEMITTENHDLSSGEIGINVYFLATDLTLIKKTRKKNLHYRDLGDIVKEMPIEHD